jgi:hypothetical protein
MPRILGQALDVLTEEFWLASQTNKNFDGAAGQIGDNVVIAKPVANSTYSITPAATPPAFTDQTKDQVTLTIDTWKGSRFHFTSREAGQYRLSDQVPNAIKEAARALAYQFNSDLWATYKGVYGYAGTAGTNPFATNVNPVADVRKVLNQQFCPEGERKLVLDYAAETAALQTDDLKKMLNAGDANALRRGVLGNLFGFEVSRDFQVPTHTAGTSSGHLINNGGGYAAGIKTVTVDTGTGTMLVGDILTFAGVTGTYVVTSALAANSVSFEPGLAGAVADNAAVTVKATHVVNLAFDPQAFGVVMKTPGDSIEGAPTIGPSMTMVHPKSGIPMKLSYLPGYHGGQWELSILYGVKLVDPRRAARLAG